MKKMLIIIIVIVIFLLFLIFPKNKENQVKSNVSSEYKYSFYKEENKKRYLLYQEKNKDLELEDVIVRVNLNLDKPFYSNTTVAKDLNTNYVLVNKYNYLDRSYIPNDLEKLDSCTVTDKDIFLVKDAKNSFLRMCSDMRKDNLIIRAISGYRSYLYQEDLYNNYVNKDGVKLADTYSARPGFSEHQTGLVIDVDNGKEYYENFENTDEFVWLENNAYKYGFILRYPQKKESITGYSYESWHYRYVGLDIAKTIYENNITFDEYYAKFIDN